MIHKSRNKFAVGKTGEFTHKLADCSALLPATRENIEEEASSFMVLIQLKQTRFEQHKSDSQLHLSVFLSEIEIDTFDPARILLIL